MLKLLILVLEQLWLSCFYFGSLGRRSVTGRLVDDGLLTGCVLIIVALSGRFILRLGLLSISYRRLSRRSSVLRLRLLLLLLLLRIWRVWRLEHWIKPVGMGLHVWVHISRVHVWIVIIRLFVHLRLWLRLLRVSATWIWSLGLGLGSLESVTYPRYHPIEPLNAEIILPEVFCDVGLVTREVMDEVAECYRVPESELHRLWNHVATCNVSRGVVEVLLLIWDCYSVELGHLLHCIEHSCIYIL